MMDTYWYPDRKLMTKRFSRSLLTLVLMIAAFTTLASAARAGTYVMSNCSIPGRPAATLGPWYWEAAANITPLDSCTQGAGFSFYFGGNVSMPRGAASALTLALPPNGPISIRRVRLWTVGRLAGTGSALFVGTNAGASDGQVTNSDLFGPPGGDTMATPHTTAVLPLGTNVFRVLLYCSQSSPDDCYPSSRSVLEVLGAEVTLLESVAPSVGVTGGSLVSGGPQSGTQTLRYSATDAESGIETVELLVDGSVAVSRNFGPECPRSGYAACLGTRSEGLSLDTGALTNGSHRVRVRATDAAGNSAESAVQVVEVRHQNAVSPSAPVRDGRVTARFAGTSKRTATVSYGGQPKVTGRLTDADGGGIAGAAIAVVEKVAGEAASVTPVGKTGADGRYAFRLRRHGRSRTVRVRYLAAGDGDAGASPVLRLKVRASASLRVALDGIRVRYRGKVVSRPIPSGGVVVVMQGRRKGGAWQSFAVRRVRGAGRFAGSYRLRVRRPGVALQFRALLGKAAGYRYEAGTSSIVTRRVR